MPIKVFFLILSFSSVSASADILLEAEERALAGDRIGATKLISQRLQEQPNERELLLKALDEHAHIFYREQTQNYFQKAKSLYVMGSDQAESYFLKAVKLEPHNHSLLLGLASFYLHKKKCSQALKMTDRGLAVNGLSEKLWLQKIRALDCLERRAEAQSFALQRNESTEIRAELLAIKAKWEYQAGRALLAETLSKRAIAIKPDYPENYYWLKKALEKQEKSPSPELANKYRELCKGSSETRLRRYSNSPQACDYLSVLSLGNEPKSN